MSVASSPAAAFWRLAASVCCEACVIFETRRDAHVSAGATVKCTSYQHSGAALPRGGQGKVYGGTRGPCVGGGCGTPRVEVAIESLGGSAQQLNVWTSGCGHRYYLVYRFTTIRACTDPFVLSTWRLLLTRLPRFAALSNCCEVAVAVASALGLCTAVQAYGHVWLRPCVDRQVLKRLWCVQWA